MGELSTTVTIAGRTYPLTISKEDEANVREAARLINERVKEYESNYSIRDKQDLLAMCALQLVNHHLKNPPEDKGVAAKLEGMEALITGFLDERK